MNVADFLADYAERNLGRWLDRAYPYVVVYAHHDKGTDLAFLVRYKSKVHYYGDRYYWWANNYVLHTEHAYRSENADHEGRH